MKTDIKWETRKTRDIRANGAAVHFDRFSFHGVSEFFVVKSNKLFNAEIPRCFSSSLFGNHTNMYEHFAMYAFGIQQLCNYIFAAYSH